MLKIAVPNKGALSEAASGMLREAGYAQRSDSKQLTKIDPDNEVEFFYLRPRDIALYVGEGTLDVGITGRDLLKDSGAKAEEVLGLGFGRSRFRFAGRRQFVRRGGFRLRAAAPDLGRYRSWHGSADDRRNRAGAGPAVAPCRRWPAAPCPADWRREWF